MRRQPIDLVLRPRLRRIGAVWDWDCPGSDLADRQPRAARPWAETGLRGSFFRLSRSLEAVGRVADGLTFHGLRHTAATQMRRLGFDTCTIADMLGQETEVMVEHDSREADLEPKLRGVVTTLDKENGKREGIV
ncbi:MULTISPECIES: tyrosine-type recombinase/integrase [Methylobacterium]|uniref:tyrosine-type recombinase/integrase n=1 Tax=Methylobacterium TaxID=407 RepID=UPI0013EC04C9|nr:tyrosine-type recombinase/integrase [Methylobacterium sp. DB0501]NGM34801.1 tyrosine-type recombinase/integrase [Methylobacterium sp. DB0501]